MIKKLFFVTALAAGALQTQAVVLQFDGLRADQTVRQVQNRTLQEKASEGFSALQSDDPATGALLAGNRLQKYSWQLFQQVDIDGDGLQDTVTLNVTVKGSKPLQNGTGNSFAVGSPEGLAPGTELTVSVSDIRYVLATGKKGKGSFKSFDAITLNSKDRIRINGQILTEASRMHQLDINSPSLRIQPADEKNTAPAISGISFEIETSSQGAAMALPIFSILSPIFLLLLRSGGSPARELIPQRETTGPAYGTIWQAEL